LDVPIPALEEQPANVARSRDAEAPEGAEQRLVAGG
jgi:hypothetical protein